MFVTEGDLARRRKSFAKEQKERIAEQEREAEAPDIQARYDVRQSTKAMKTTQKRAGADRAEALRELRDSRGAALTEFDTVPQDVISDITAGKQFAGQRDLLAGQKSAQLRNIQRSFYGGGSAPSGAMLSAAMSAERTSAGQLAGAKREIDINKELKNWESRFGLAREKAGIRSDVAPHIANVLGNTIAEVPDLGNVAPELQPQSTAPETYGRNEGEMNIDFLKRDPSGYKKWYANRGQPTRSVRV